MVFVVIFLMLITPIVTFIVLVIPTMVIVFLVSLIFHVLILIYCLVKPKQNEQYDRHINQNEKYDSHRRYGCTCPERCGDPRNCRSEWCCTDFSCPLHGRRWSEFVKNIFLLLYAYYFRNNIWICLSDIIWLRLSLCFEIINLIYWNI